MRQQNSVDNLSPQAITAYKQAMSELLEKVQPGSFRVVELKPRTLKVQLDTFLDNSDLFKELQNCSLNWEKRLVDDNKNYRVRRGWLFEWVWQPELLLKLIQHKVQGVVLVEADTVVSTEPFQFLKNQQLWIGFPIVKNEIELPSNSASWNLCFHQEQWYWVSMVDKLIWDWLILPFQVSRFYEPMSIFFSWHKMPQWLEMFRLTDHFRQWVSAKIKVTEVTKISPFSSGWENDHWEHPADRWLAFYNQFPQKNRFNAILRDGTDLAQASLTIFQLKQAASFQAREKSRQEAIAKAFPKLKESWTKAELQELSQKFEITIKKSDSKAKLIAALLESDKAQAIAEDVLEIPKG